MSTAATKTVEELLTEVEDLKIACNGLEEDVKRLEDENDDLERETSRLEREVTRLENEIESHEIIVKALNLYADPSNWNGNTFTPMFASIHGSEPYSEARAALNSYEG